jgi:N-dimethylarginine dimethylaminohydrolase
MNEYGRLIRVVLKHPRDAFRDASTIDSQWRDLNFTAAPDLDRAAAEYDALIEIIRHSGAAIDFLPAAPATTLDSIYVRDASIATPRGMVLCTMGKRQRAAEPDAQAAAFGTAGIPVVGRITPPGKIEGGDLIWLDSSTLAVGRGYRTNDEGIAQLAEILNGPAAAFAPDATAPQEPGNWDRSAAGEPVTIITVPLPHWSGENDVMHLMSLISPIDRDLAVVYSKLLPVPFREWLVERGVRFVEVPDGEFDSMGTNVLALAPRQCLVVRGNPRTRSLLERAGAEVFEYEGVEISAKGAGGPTCLTRPISRAGATLAV